MKEKYEFETTIVSKGNILGAEYGSQYSSVPECPISIDSILKEKLEEDQKYIVKIIIEKEEI